MLFSCTKLLTILLGHEGYTRFDSLIAYKKKKQQENTEKFITFHSLIIQYDLDIADPSSMQDACQI